MTAAQERKAARQLIAAAALAGDRLELADALEAVRAEETDRVAPKYRIETAAGSTWSHYAIATEPADVARLVAQARRAGHRSRILDRRGDVVHVHHDAAGRVQLMTIPD